MVDDRRYKTIYQNAFYAIVYFYPTSRAGIQLELQFESEETLTSPNFLISFVQLISKFAVSSTVDTNNTQVCFLCTRVSFSSACPVLALYFDHFGEHDPYLITFNILI